MEKGLSRSRVILRSGRDGSVRRFHPWIYSGAVDRVEGEVQPGDLVDVHTRDGAFLATGHYYKDSIAVKILAFEPVEKEDKLILSRIEAAYALRKSLPLNETSAYRLMNGEGDHLPGLIIDVYNSTAVIDCQTVGMERSLESIQSALRTVLGNAFNIHVRSAEAEKVSSFAKETITENGHRFLVDYVSGQKTGFFLDQRESRKLVQDFSSRRRVLNAFSYTGAFSVYALAGGAESVHSVDSSKPALEILRENIGLNFPHAHATDSSADCFDYLETIRDQFDLIVLDPPAFAKHRNAVDRAYRGYETINRLALEHIDASGLLFTFSCSQLVTREMFKKMVTAAAVKAKRKVQIIKELGAAPCHPVNIYHPEGEYLKGLMLRVE